VTSCGPFHAICLPASGILEHLLHVLVFKLLAPFVLAGCDLGYNWFSEDPSVATVDPSGTVHAVGPGQTRVFAAAAFDELNVASTSVRVTVPASLQHVPSLPVDVQVGEVAPAAVKVFDSEGMILSIFAIRFVIAKH
jgi:hypothetical protein